MNSLFSVIIVTYNRHEDVKETVQSLINQSIKSFEILLIDDCSNPPVQLDIPTNKVKLIRFVKEVGVSAARNYGLKLARGEYVALIDDDAIADENWLEEMQKGIKMGADVLGGPIKPLFENIPPEWWNENDFGHYVSIGNAPNKYKDFTPGIWSTNMAVRKKIVKDVGDFNLKVGRQKGKLLAREDVDLVNRAKEKGYRILFLPEAKVYHKVKSERMTIRYILRWEYYMGKSTSILYGYKASKLFLELGKSLLSLMLSIFQRKSEKILAIARIANRLGRF